MAAFNMGFHPPLSSTNDSLFEDYLASRNHQEGICIGGAPQGSKLDLSVIKNNCLTTIAKGNSTLLSKESKLKILSDAVWEYRSDAWCHNAQTAEAPLNKSAYRRSAQQYSFDSIPPSSGFGNPKEKFDRFSGSIDPSLLSDPPLSAPGFTGESDTGESDTGESDTDIKNTVRGAAGSYDVLQENSEFPLSPKNEGYITSRNIEISKRVLVEGLSTMLVDSYQFSHVLELKNDLSCKEKLLMSSGSTQKVSLETKAPSINDHRRIECQFPDCEKKKGFKSMQIYTIHMRKHQECSTKDLLAYPSRVSDIDLANTGIPLPYVIPPPVNMEDKVFRCPYAGCELKPFKSINTFRRHCDSVHSGKEAECPFCMLERSDRKDEDNSKKVHLFTRADALQKHLKRMHPLVGKNDHRVLEVMRILRRGDGKGVIWDKTTEPAGKGFEGRDENGMLVEDSITQKRKRTKACNDHSQKLKKTKPQKGPSKAKALRKVKEEETISSQFSLSLSGHYSPSFNSSGSFSCFQLDLPSSLFPSTNGTTEVVAMVPLRKRERTSTAAPGKGKMRAKVSKIKREADSDEETASVSAKRLKSFYASDTPFERTGVAGLGEAMKKENGFLGLGKEVVGQNVALKFKVLESATASSASSFGYCFSWPDNGASFYYNAGDHQIQSSDTSASAVTYPALWGSWAMENVINTDTWRPDCPQQISQGETNLPVSIQSAEVREFTENHVENPAVTEEHGMLIMEEEDYIDINNSGVSLGTSSSSMISQNDVTRSYGQPHQVHLFGLPAQPIPES